MEERFAVRLKEMLSQAEVAPDAVQGMDMRLATFIEPFAALLAEPEQQAHVVEYVTGLLSKLERKTGESIAYLYDHERQGLQKFLGQTSWDHRPLVHELCRRVAQEIGEPDGVLAFDPSPHVKKGKSSVGVARQWCGRLAKVENCQVAVYMAYVSRKEHALVDTRLYLPKEWTGHRARKKKSGVPKGTRFKKRHALALEMLDEVGPLLPHAWVTGDDEMGRSGDFRSELRDRGERYVLDVPSNTWIRDLEGEVPEYSGKGRHRKRKFERADAWLKSQPKGAWTKLTVRHGEKGPLEVEALQRRVEAKSGRKAEELLFVTRERLSDKTYKYDFHLSHGPPETPLSELARAAKAEHRIEECLERAKGEAGLSDYQVRTWKGWHHHQTLSLIAAWFLVEETRRGKNRDPGADGPACGRHDAEPPGTDPEHEHRGGYRQAHDAMAPAKRTRSLIPPLFTQPAAVSEEATELVGTQ
jgi:SRSO17 transposase